MDVYNLIMSLARHDPEFITERELEANGVIPRACQAIVDKAFNKQKSKLENRFTLIPQPDDAVEPQPTLYLSTGSKERILYHVSIKDTTDIFNKCYSNLDIAVTSARIFFWKRDCYKKFDCCALLQWLVLWMACLNKLANPTHLSNEMSFMTLPSILSFSTDVSVVAPSWFVPHHMPLKWPCVEMLCAYLTRCAVRGSYQVKSRSQWSCCPRRSGPSSALYLLWRLKQSAHADNDMLVLHTVRPYVFNSMPQADAEDIFDGLGYIAEAEKAAETLVQEQAECIETLRKIMCAVQDSCHSLLNKVEDLGGFA
jgi:hypothetical protein